MTSIESNPVSLSKSRKEVFDFLSDLNNHQQLMPEMITNWSSTKDECSFSIQHMITLSMRVAERREPEEVRIVNQGQAPVQTALRWVLSEAGSGCTVRLIVDADMNPMMKMMVGDMLTKLVNKQAEKLASVLA